MAIIKYTKETTPTDAYLNRFPDQFLTSKQKEDEGFIKNTTDYFANKAYTQFMDNKNTFVKNYGLVKGILIPEDFYQDPEVKSFTNMLMPDSELPPDVQNYSIMSAPINSLVGEITKRPDKYKTKAFDDDSRSEELAFKTETLQKFVMDQAKQKIYNKAQMEGVEIPDEELGQMTAKETQEDLDNYTSVAEKFSNRILECQKVDFNMKEKSEDGFRDLCIAAREFFHLYEDNSKLGYNIEVANTKNVWHLSTTDKKYVSDPSGRAQGSYAAGTIQVMELSEIIESIPDLTKEEIDHLRSSSKMYGFGNLKKSNLGTDNTGIESIMYDAQDPLMNQHNAMIENSIDEHNKDSLSSYLGINDSAANITHGTKFVVLRAYCISKRKIGKVVFIDKIGNPQSTIVDDTYVSKDMPTEISLSWGWVNQWHQFIKVGTDVYLSKPFKLLNYCPIIGTFYEQKNTKAKSVVDLMKPFQAVCNLALNQLWRLLQKEMGKVQLMSLRHIPVPKDGDAQDAIDIWEQEARDRGVIFVDDSPENLKAPSSFNQFTALDLTRTQEIQSRYTLYQQMKLECWELVGMSKQRLGSVAASESATGVNASIQQSYTQTEPLFIAHEYVMGQVYQAIVDASLYIESSKPESTLSYITSEGESAFIKVNGADLKFRDLKVFLTNRKEDVEAINEAKQLSQAILQNGGSVYEVLELRTTNSMRDIKKTFKDLKEKIDNDKAQAQQLEQQKIEQQTKQSQEALAQAKLIADEAVANDNYQKELDRINKKEIAAIAAYAKNDNALNDSNKDGVADSLQITAMANETSNAEKQYQLKMQELQNKMVDSNNKKQSEADKRQVERENMKNDLEVAKENAKGRASNRK